MALDIFILYGESSPEASSLSLMHVPESSSVIKFFCTLSIVFGMTQHCAGAGASQAQARYYSARLSQGPMPLPCSEETSDLPEEVPATSDN